jgi:hypothetical protein
VIDRLRAIAQLDDQIGRFAIVDESATIAQDEIAHRGDRVARQDDSVAARIAVEERGIDIDFAATRDRGLQIIDRVIDSGRDEQLLRRRLIRLGDAVGRASGQQ